MFKTWKEAFDAQQAQKSNYDNGVSFSAETGITAIDEIPFSLGNIVWLIMAEDYSLHDYEESCTEYGIREDGTWCAVYDGHCSCYGWETSESSITDYDSLEQLFLADEKARVIKKYDDKLKQAYPFLVDFELARSAPDSTELLNEVKAVEGILTEEELNNIHDDIYGSLDYAERAMLAKLIESHVSLLSANAELSFKNQKYKSLVESVLKAHRDRGAIMTEVCGGREAVLIAYEMEELK